MKYNQNIQVYRESIVLFYISQFRYNDEPLKIRAKQIAYIRIRKKKKFDGRQI